MKVLWIAFAIFIIDAFNVGYFMSIENVNPYGHDLIVASDIFVTYYMNEKSFIESIEASDFLILNTDSKELELRIILFSEMHEIPIIIMGKGKNTKWVFYTEPDLDCFKKSLKSLLKYLEVNKLAVLYSAQIQNIELSSDIKSEFPHSVSAGLDLSLPYYQVEELIGKYYKTQGFKEFLLILHDYNCVDVAAALSALNLFKPWNLFIYSNECITYIENIGTIGIVYYELDSADSIRTYKELSLLRYINTIKNKLLDRSQIRKSFEQVKTPCKHSILNYLDTKLNVVGYIENEKVKIIENFTDVWNSKTKKRGKNIPIKITTSSNDFDTTLYDSKQNQMYNQGTQFMVDYVNKEKSYLGDFEIKLNEGIKCLEFFENSSSCLLYDEDDLGVAFIPSFYFSSLSTITSLRSQGINITAINGMGSTSKHSKIPSDYFRIVSTLDSILEYSTHILELFSPLNFIVFYSDDPWGQMIYSKLVNFEQLNLLSIINDVKYRKIPLDFKPSMMENFKDHIENAFDTGCYFVILAMSHPTPFYFLEALYDFGIRRGDFAYFFVTPTGSDALKVNNEKQKEKRVELLHGSHFLYASYWSGSFGNELKEKYEKSGYQTWLPCFYMDAVLAIVNSIKLLLNSGKDYDNSLLFTNTLQTSKFIGVTGSIKFDQDSHSREGNSVSFYNIFQDPYTKKFVIKETAKTSPTTLNYLKIEKSVWPLSEVHPKSMKEFPLIARFLNIKLRKIKKVL